MATLITLDCINCSACVPECPNHAIYPPGRGWNHNGRSGPPLSREVYYIVPELCTECVGFFEHLACAAVCPVDCCIPDPRRAEPEETLIARARRNHPDKTFDEPFPSRFRPRNLNLAPESPQPLTSVHVGELKSLDGHEGMPASRLDVSQERLDSARLRAMKEERIDSPESGAGLGRGVSAEIREGEPRKDKLESSTSTAKTSGMEHVPHTPGERRHREVSSKPPTAASSAPSQGAGSSEPGGAIGGAAHAIKAPPTVEPLPGPLEEKRFPDELEGDFESLLNEFGVRLQRPQTTRAKPGLLKRLAERWTRSSAENALVERLHRTIAYDGYRSEQWDRRIERDRRYGTVYTVTEFARAYLVRLEFPRVIPDSSLKRRWAIGDEMPDYDYALEIEPRALIIRAGVRGLTLRRLAYVSPSFPTDFVTRIEVGEEIAGYRQRLINKELQVLLVKATPETASIRK